MRFPFNQKVTNLSNTLDEIYNKYSHQNVGAIILASDGIYNQGNNPIYSNAQLTRPFMPLRSAIRLHSETYWSKKYCTIALLIWAINSRFEPMFLPKIVEAQLQF